ncbi:hypothetical protein FACS1894164_13340 [Spirochaetia bacterium]|nr:hypothetical protein FACS1894164_13340 [Spirochaetia bacterium]
MKQFAVLVLLFILSLPAPAQEDATRERDIATSTLNELVLWCRNLGLSETGTKEEVAGRIRNYYHLPAPESAPVSADRSIRTITVNAAQHSEYFTVKEVNEEYARFRGGVSLTLNDGSTTHRIQANEILFNRTRNMVTASGGVSYARISSEREESFRGDSIHVNLNTWESTFVDGASTFANNDTAYEFSGTVISRTDAGTTVLKDATIRNAQDEESLWSVHASQIWLLPGSDFAILNAVLKVGEIPVFYFPFLHIPSDEIMFHPVLGTRPREGSFVQTTTYIFGRSNAPVSSENSLTSIMGNNDAGMEKKREGVFLRSTGRKAIDPNTTRFSILLDAYTNLGYYIGAELALPKKTVFDAIDLSAGIAFSRDVHQQGSYYTPFDASGSDTWNHSRIFSIDVPFRYRLTTTGSLSGTYGSFSWSVPVYSDPFVDSDFLTNRSEKMDYMNMLMGSDSTTTTTTYKNSYEWQIRGNLNPKITNLSPGINSLSISNISSTMAFSSRENRVSPDASPDRVFFYPDKWTIFSLNAAIAGTPWSFGAVQPPPASSTNPHRESELANNIIAPWESLKIPESKNAAPTDDQLSPPVLTQRFSLPTDLGGPRLAFDYSFSPSGVSELQYRNSADHWKSADAVSLNDVRAVVSKLGITGNFGLNLSQPSGRMYSSSLRFSFSGAWEDYSYMNEEAEEFDSETKRANAWKDRYNAQFFSTAWEFNTSLQPFAQSPIFGTTNFQYLVKGPIIKTVFSGTGIDPQWDWEKGELSDHRLTANLAAQFFNKMQTASLVADMLPDKKALALNATFRIFFTETTFQGKVMEGDKTFDTMKLSETIRFGPNNNFTIRQELSYDPEKKKWLTALSTLSGYGFSASFNAAQSKPWNLVADQGWVQDTTAPESFVPTLFRTSYSKTFKPDLLLQNRFLVNFTVNPSLDLDLIKYTQSKFSFSMRFSLHIGRFFDINFSILSENAEIFRYVMALPDFGLPQKNIFTDQYSAYSAFPGF